MKRQLVESMQNVDIVRVERVQHRLLWRRYAAKRDEIQRKCAGIGVADHADLRLWHGTGSTDPQAILRSESGLDERLSSQGFYGKSIYLPGGARAVFKWRHRGAGGCRGVMHHKRLHEDLIIEEPNLRLTQSN